jgi:hypothetical protein
MLKIHCWLSQLRPWNALLQLGSLLIIFTHLIKKEVTQVIGRF